jgi:hypothetical protein
MFLRNISHIAWRHILENRTVQCLLSYKDDRHQNGGRNQYIKIVNESFENVANFRLSRI